eukprot:654688-Rhodomonas_salina.2
MRRRETRQTWARGERAREAKPEATETREWGGRCAWQATGSKRRLHAAKGSKKKERKKKAKCRNIRSNIGGDI